MKPEEKEGKPHYGIVNFERRKFPRFSVDLPVEYEKVNSFIPAGRVINISKGGLLIYFPERMEIGQHLKLRLFFSGAGSNVKVIEALVVPLLFNFLISIPIFHPIIWNFFLPSLTRVDSISLPSNFLLTGRRSFSILRMDSI